MKDYEAKAQCAITCWIVAALAGAALGGALWLLADYRPIQAIFMGILLAGVLGLVLVIFLCRTPSKLGENMAVNADGASAKPAAPTAGASAAAGGAASAAPTSAATSAPAATAATATATASAPAAKAKPAAKPKAAAKPAAKPVAKDGKPETLDKPRDGGPDDLKQIKGVGPKLEKLLHSMGFYHFDQVASWRAKEVKWVDENLEGFKGRVSRDEWVKQAKVLAKGGETEFSKKVAKGGVYE